MTVLTDPIVAASIVAAIPATIAAVLSYLANRRSKTTIGLAQENSIKLDHIGNGMMDAKIKSAVKEILDEQGHKVTEAFITDVLGKILDKHLEEGN